MNVFKRIKALHTMFSILVNWPKLSFIAYQQVGKLIDGPLFFTAIQVN